jgi:carboxylesterase
VVGVRGEDDSGGGQTTDPDRLRSGETLPFLLRAANATGASAGGDRLGCLLVHGFTGTPQEMRFLGECLHRDGYTVSGVRLAGHCTSVDDLARTRWQDWYGSVRSGVEELQQDAPQVVVVGQSMGALLALKLAVEHPQAIAGLVLLAPALELSNPWVRRLGPALRLLLPLLKQTRRHLGRGERDVADHQARSESPSYRHVPLPALHQLLVLQDHVQSILSHVRQPALIMHSRQDHTCPPSNVALLERSLRGPIRSVLLEESFHVISIDVDRERVASEVTAFVAGVRGPATARAPSNFCD